MAAEARKVKIKDKPVDSRYRPGGFTPGVEYEVSKQEAKELVDAGLASYSQSGSKSDSEAKKGA